MMINWTMCLLFSKQHQYLRFSLFKNKSKVTTKLYKLCASESFAHPTVFYIDIIVLPQP